MAADDRHESPTERLDRNWADLLQELRVEGRAAGTGAATVTAAVLTLLWLVLPRALRERGGRLR